MITYVDTSTLIKLIVDEEGSDRADVIWQSADQVAAASLILVEARAVLASAARLGRLTNAQHRAAKSELDALCDELHVVAITDQLVIDAAEIAEKIHCSAVGLEGRDRRETRDGTRLVSTPDVGSPS